eukprot:2505496-Prymnesium_polylepis.1
MSPLALRGWFICTPNSTTASSAFVPSHMSCPSARSPSRTTESVSRRSSYSCRFAAALLPTAAALPCAAIA